MLGQQLIPPDFVLKLHEIQTKLTQDLEQEVERLWLAEQKRRGKTLFNGRILSAKTILAKELIGYIAEYRYWIAQQAQAELFKDLQVRPVAVSGLLVCRDGIVFGRRADSMTQDAGLWELVPSGGIDTSKLTIDSMLEVDFLSQLLTELEEEIGIQSKFIYNMKPFCLVEDMKSHVLDIGIQMETSVSYEDLLITHRNCATKEYETLRLVPLTRINQFMQEEASMLVSVSTVLLQQYCKSCNIPDLLHSD